MSWTHVDTVRCASCRVFAPIGEVLYATDGSTHCVVCGVPARAADDLEVDVVRGDGYRPPYAVVAAVIGVTNLLFFAAAWVSQL